MSLSITIERCFEAAHRLPDYVGKCSQLHGHSWRLEVTACGEVSPVTGMVVDFTRFKKMIDTYIIDHLDHQYLGQGILTDYNKGNQFSIIPAITESFLPTAENLVLYIRDQLQAQWARSMPSNTWLESVAINETCTTEARWSRDANANN